MTQAKHGDTVKIHFTGKLKDGSVFASSANRTPFEFTLGQQQVLPALEQAVVGMRPGEQKTTDIPSDRAYGPHNEELVQEIERSSLPEDLDPEVGMHLRVSGLGNQTLVVTIVEVGEATVMLDANHPLAGRDLILEIQLLEIA